MLALCALAFVTRAQTVALVAAVLTAPLVLAWIERGRPRRLSAFRPLYGIVGLVAVLVVVVEVARGRSPAQILGNYSVTSNGGYHVWPVLKWIVLHVAELDLSLWILPFAALIVLVANARHLDRPLRVFVAATTSVSVWLVLEVGAFASQYSQRIEERNLFYVAPLFLIALLAWIERGQPKPPSATVAAAGLAAALPGAIPFLSLLNINSQSDTIGLQPWWYVGDAWAGRTSVAVVAVLLSIGLGAAFLWLPRRYAPVLPVLVALGFLATWLPVELWTHSFPRLSRSAYAQGIGAGKSWIDRAVGPNADVAVLWSGGNRYGGLAERVLEPQRPAASTASARRCRAACPRWPCRSAPQDRATGILRDRQGPRARRSVRAHEQRRHPRRPQGRRRPGEEARPLPRVGAGSGDDEHPRASTRSGRTRGRTGRVVWTRSDCRPGTLTAVVSSDALLFRGTTQTLTIGGTTPAQTLHLAPTTSPPAADAPAHAAERRLPRHVRDLADAETGRRTRACTDTDTRRLGLHFNALHYAPRP